MDVNSTIGDCDSNNNCDNSSGSDSNSDNSEVVCPKRRRLSYSSDEEIDILGENDDEDNDEWEDIIDDDNYIPSTPFSTFPKIPGPQIPRNIIEPIQCP